MRLSDTFKRLVVSGALALFLSVNLLAFLAIPQRANAQFVVTQPEFTAKWTWEKIESSLYSSLLASLINGASYFMRKIAYDTARYVASGGKGQGALAFQNGAGAYFAEVAGNTAGEIIDQFGKPFGLDLCKPPDLKVQAYLQVSLRRIYDQNGGENGPQPNCSFQQLTSNWSNAQEQYREQGKDIGQAFANSLRVNQGDFGIALGLAARVDRNVVAAQRGAQTDREEGGGFKPLTDLISGEVKTPAQVIKTETESVSSKQQTELSFSQLNGIYGSGALQIVPMAASVFLNTLTSQLLDSVLSGGLFPTGGGADGSAVVDAYSSAVNRNRDLAERAFSYLIASIPTQIASYDILAQYSSCPDDGRLAGVNNCVINTQLRQALDRARGGNPLTIADAIKEGFLDPNAELIPPSRDADNSNKQGCISDKKYCYSNIQKMRKVRILPLGFEIAALKSDPDQPWRLGQVVAGFEDCVRTPNGVAVPDSTKPFCHLIDPNWVLKVPDAQCQTQVISEQLETETAPNRREECADISTCLAKDEKGACINYGYCTQEKNVWRLGAQSCSEKFNTCRTFVNARDNSVVSYLTRTMDYGECTQESVGCRAYSTEQVGDKWVASTQANNNLKALGRSQTMYYGDKIKNFTCTPAAEGATAFYPLLATGVKSTSPVYLKKAPDYLGCYDANPATAAVDFAKTEADLAKITPNAQCGNFAGTCVESEVGCRLYQPADGSPELTAKIGANRCDVQCIGYDTFKQEPSNFEAAAFPLHFIPKQGVSCPAEDKYIGCSEFTNLENESAEYFSSLKYCEKPASDGSNIQTYYTWEGTVSQGYVLRVHKLLPLRANEAATINNYNLGSNANGQFPIGSPAYAQDSRSAVEGFLTKCNATNYQLGLNEPFNANRADADCRAFYNDQGVIFYRLLAQTVTVDQACHSLRKTEASFASDPDIKDLGMCTQRGGFWQDGSCQRCVGGGKYVNGACVYQTISRPGESVSCEGPSRKDQYNGCRAYTGNNVGNIQTVLSKEGTFEPASADPTALVTAKAGWSAGTVKPESIQVGQYSLNIPDNEQSLFYTFPSGTLKQGESYELQFWARGDANNLTVGLTQGQAIDLFSYDAVAKTPLQLTISPEWRPYRLGPIQFTGNGNTNDVRLFFKKDKNTQYYLDNVAVTRLTSKTAIIKNSWRAANGGNEVPLACDSNPTDAFPGAALGCREFTDLNTKAKTQATGFEKLCRPQAAGCSALYDSHNTLDTEKTAVFNAWCVGPEGTCTIKSGTVTLGSCTVKPGQTGCFVNRLELGTGQTLPANATVKSTVVVAADTSTSTPVFLTDRSEFRLADGSQLGCQKVALENQNLPTVGASNASTTAYSFSQSYFRNDPALYAQILCRDDLVGCSEFRSGSEVRYARDPKLVGNKLCSYKQDLQLANGTKASGWFMDGVGKCNNGSLCRADADCGGTAKSCQGIGEVACYADNILPGGEYGIWSQKTSNYQGFVGQCPAEANNCTELLDPADKSTEEPSGKAYYAILDEAFRNRSAACDGKASLKSGCVLFNQTETPNKLFNTQQTYQKSIDANNQLVAPVSDAGNDSNIILKVDRDRQCSEWLACKTSMTVQDPATGKTKRLCYQYSACRKLGPSGACEEWVTVDKTPNQRLTENVYVGRPTAWQAADYTGYSLLNKYPVADYTYVNFGDGDIKSYLAYEIPQTVLGQNPEALSCGPESKNGDKCGDGTGRCYSNRCIYPIGGGFNEGVNNTNPEAIKGMLNPGICKSYPEKDSPYAQQISLTKKPEKGLEIKTLGDASTGVSRIEFLNKKPAYSGANICQDGSAESCSCEYQKVTYKSGQTDYWPIDSTRLPQGICTVGERCPAGKQCVGADGKEDTAKFESTIGQPCNRNSECGLAGSCSPMNRKELRTGQRGYCLEYDLSTPQGVYQDFTTGEKKVSYACLTWLPIDTSASALDLYNSYLSAGYDPATDGLVAGSTGGGELYCLATQAQNNHPGNYATGVFTGAGEGIAGSMGGNRAMVESCLAGADGYTAYEKLVCKTDPTDLKNTIQQWAQKAMGSNAQVLRVEGGLMTSRTAQEDAGIVTNKSTLSGGAETYAGALTYEQKNVKIVYALAPAVHGCRMEYGTIMHPPRVFSRTTQDYLFLQKPLLNPVYTKNYVNSNDPTGEANCTSNDGKYFEDQSYEEYDSIKKEHRYAISSMYYSPGPFMQDTLMPDHKNNYVYRSNYEGTMNENDLQKVCFVPLVNTEAKGSEGLTQLGLRLLAPDKPTDKEAEGAGGNCIYFSKKSMVREIQEQPVSAGFFQFGLSPDANGIYQWSYVLEGGDLAAMPYTNYDQEYDSNIKLTAEDADRNVIARRYVTVVFNAHTTLNDVEGNKVNDPKNVPAFARQVISDYLNKIPNPDYIPTPENDPFSVAYSFKENNNEWKDFLAIGMDFNAQGEFLGYVVRKVTPSLMEQTSNGFNGNLEVDHAFGYKFAVIAVTKNQCTNFAQVYDSTQVVGGSSNKAKTNRIWSGNESFILPNLTKLTRETKQGPFGSTNLTSDLVNDMWAMRTYSFLDDRYGVPYSCASDTDDVSSNNNAPCLGAAPYLKSDVEAQLNQQTKKDLDGSGTAAASVKRAQNDLLSFFAKIYKQVAIGDLNSGNDHRTSVTDTLKPDLKSKPGQDETGLAMYAGGAPVIYALNPATCKGGMLAGCTAGESNAFTVNSRNYTMRDYDGDGPSDEDQNFDGSSDPIVVSKSYTAILQFFAMADNDRMPLKTVTIDWGEGSNLFTREALYKNHKPFCETDSAPGKPLVGHCTDPEYNGPEYDVTQLTCRVENKNGQMVGKDSDCVALTKNQSKPSKCIVNQKRVFGDLERSCKMGYFEFVNEYNCSLPMLNNPDIGVPVLELSGRVSPEAQQRAISMLGSNVDLNKAKVCVFKPRVQVKDNWGWCNGSCKHADGKTGYGCYDGTPLAINNCSASLLDQGVDPFTSYKGSIIVLP